MNKVEEMVNVKEILAIVAVLMIVVGVVSGSAYAQTVTPSAAGSPTITPEPTIIPQGAPVTGRAS